MDPSGREFLTFSLVLVRVTALVQVAPIFGGRAVSLRIRSLLAMAIALMIVPLELPKSAAVPATLIDFLIAAGAEALVGLTLGLGVAVLFAGMQVAGHVISQMSGMQLAEIVDPGSETPTPIVSQLLCFVSLAVFVAIGGHRYVMEALLDTFVWMPAGRAAIPRSIVESATSLLAESFVLGVRAAAPAMVALLLATLILGTLSRTLPQLNVMALGFGLNALVALGILSVSLGAMAWIFQDQVDPMLHTALDALRPGS
jgi:flagellar biosynthesis protein FliR